MKNKKVWIAVIAVALIAVTVYSCSKKDNGTTTSTTTPPITAAADSVLINLGTNIILPAYQALSTSVTAFDAAVTAFNANPTAATLTAVQNAFKDAYKAYETSSPFEFGPALDAGLTTANVNVFPTDTTIIKGNINTGTYIIDALGNLKAQGFPAVDYLLFAYDNTTVLARFTTNGQAAVAKKYLADISASLKSKSTSVLSTWTNTYLKAFIANTGVNAGSSLSLYVNAFVYNYDVILKNNKIGIPVGIYGPTILPLNPTKVEGYYSGLSLQLLLTNLQAIQNAYLGGNGLGLDDKVIATSVTKNGLPLNDVIKAQITTAIAKVQAIPETLSNSISTNLTVVTAAYTEVAKLVVLIKVDMCAALGVKISFQDDDGD